MLSDTIGLDTLGMLYTALLDLGIMTVLEALKYSGQNPAVRQELHSQVSSFKMSGSTISFLIWGHVRWSKPGADQPEQPTSASVSSNDKIGTHSLLGLDDKA